MKNWRAIAEASGLDLSSGEMNRIVGPLDALEEAFRPLVKDLEPGLEPATGLRIAEDEE